MPDGTWHTCARDWPLPPGFSPRTILHRWKLFGQDEQWYGKVFRSGEIGDRQFFVNRTLITRIITSDGAEPRIVHNLVLPRNAIYYCDPIHDAIARARLRKDLEVWNAAGERVPRQAVFDLPDGEPNDSPTFTPGEVLREHVARARVSPGQRLGHPWRFVFLEALVKRSRPGVMTINGRCVLLDTPLAALHGPEEAVLIKRIAADRVRKRFAVLSLEKYDAKARRWPGRCFRAGRFFYDERLQEFRLVHLTHPPGCSSRLEERGIKLTVRLAGALHSKARQQSLQQLYELLHHRSAKKGRMQEIAGIIYNALWREVPDLKSAISASPALGRRLLEAIRQRRHVGLGGSRATHYQGTHFLARHLAAIAIGSPTDDERTVRGREELISRRLKFRHGRIHLLPHPARRLS